MTAEAASTRPLLDKLGVRFGAAVALLDWDPRDGFSELLAERTDDVVTATASSHRPRSGGFDLVFLQVRAPADLLLLAGLKSSIKPNGAIWVVRVKGEARVIKDTDVIDAGLSAGLVDNKIVSFSDTLAAMRLVIRLRDR